MLRISEQPGGGGARRPVRPQDGRIIQSTLSKHYATRRHLAAGELIEVAETLAAYWGWRHGGGFFEPKDGDALAKRLRRRLVQRSAPNRTRKSVRFRSANVSTSGKLHRRDGSSDGDAAEANG